jgi:hypothetical protein
MLNVFVCENKGIVRTLQMHFLHMRQYLIKEKGYGKIRYDSLVGLDTPGMVKLFIEKFGAIPDNIIFYECLDKIHILAIPQEIKINVLVDDIHHEGRTKKNEIIGLKKTTRIFSTYGYLFSKYFDTTVPVYFFPHSSGFVNDINYNPLNKILVSGRLNPTIYPFRQFMVDSASKNSNIEVLKVNCPYRLTEHDTSLTYGKNYIDTLSKYLCCFTCDAVDFRPYILAKNFEILASGSLLLAGNSNTIKYFAKLGFIDGEDYISADKTNIMYKISYILDPANAEIINKIRISGHHKFCNTHTFFHRAKWLDDILNNISECSILQTDGENNSNYYTKIISVNNICR